MAKKQTLGKHITPAETQRIYNWILEGKSNKEVFALCQENNIDVTFQNIAFNYRRRAAEHYEEYNESKKPEAMIALAAADERVKRLVKFVELLEKYIYDEGKLWTEKIQKYLNAQGSVENTEPIFNTGLGKCYLDALNDIAKEVGGRRNINDISITKREESVSLLIGKIYHQVEPAEEPEDDLIEIQETKQLDSAKKEVEEINDDIDEFFIGVNQNETNA